MSSIKIIRRPRNFLTPFPIFVCEHPILKSSAGAHLSTSFIPANPCAISAKSTKRTSSSRVANIDEDIAVRGWNANVEETSRRTVLAWLCSFLPNFSENPRASCSKRISLSRCFRAICSSQLVIHCYPLLLRSRHFAVPRESKVSKFETWKWNCVTIDMMSLPRCAVRERLGKWNMQLLELHNSIKYFINNLIYYTNDCLRYEKADFLLHVLLCI